MKRAFPILAVLTALLLTYSTYQALVVAPTERTMGDVQRIFYYHVPSAWTAFCLFFVNLIASACNICQSQCEAVDATSRKVDSDCNRDCWRHITIYPAGAAAVAGGIVSQFSGDHGFSDPRLLFPH